jgi:hypothetical protein
MSYSVNRDLISDNFKGFHLETQTSFDKTDVIKKVNLWKYLLTYKCQAVKGESILIGIMDVGLDYIALCIAAAELSLKIVIVDYSRPDDFVDIDFYDSKTKLLSPIDIFLHDVSSVLLEKFKEDCGKHNFFNSCSNRSYNIYEDIDQTIDNLEEYNTAKDIMPNPTDVLMKCTSSGTTGTPKIIEHTHEFLASITYRNAHKFSGKCLHTKNLNHGSSLAVYLLPVLASNCVNENLFYELDEDSDFKEFVDLLLPYTDTLEYAIFPYPFMIDKFINATPTTWKNLNLQTLSYIQDTTKEAVKNNIIKSITSIFGSNETSGPVFEISIDKNNLDRSSSAFNKVDDFFNITLDDELLNVKMPFYNTSIVTNDIFSLENGYYIHKGRSDFVKINGEIVDITFINDLNLKYNDTYIVLDTVQNSVYLAYWNEKNDCIKEKINQLLLEKFDRVSISKDAVLHKKSFLTGIKLDNEMIREYFRNYV